MTEPPTKKGFIEQVSELLADHPMVVALTSLVAAFGLGFAAARAVHEFSGNVVLSKNNYEVKENKFKKSEEENLKLTTKNQKLTADNNRLKQCEGNISVPDSSSENNKVDGNFIVEGEISPCREKRLWLIASPIMEYINERGERGTIYDKDCFVQGEVIERPNEETSPNSNRFKFTTGTTSITDKQQYKIYLLAVADAATNKELIQAQRTNKPQILCSTANLHQNQVAMITVDNR
ncbi:hypothetical protein ACQY1X_17170 [Microcystis protocystis FBCC-A270]|uniref:hypothetical protein n=1 Tax=Microcystis protocystis TaxID=629747 RepID=UPI003D2B3E97